jgi:tetratricopeptide (TPR) repeat protein/transcriptional regulator with XRE-family HTH domain
LPLDSALSAFHNAFEHPVLTASRSSVTDGEYSKKRKIAYSYQNYLESLRIFLIYGKIVVYTVSGEMFTDSGREKRTMLHGDLLEELDAEHAFGAFLMTLRSLSRGKKVKQKDIVARLPGWTISSYSRLENGDLAPRFDQLRTLCQAFREAGIPFSHEGRQQFVDFARKRIAIQKTHKDQRSDAEWAQLRFELAQMDGLPETSMNHAMPMARPLLAETSHLVGREGWREELVGTLNKPRNQKLLIIRGSAGIGKSSELNWLAAQFFRQTSRAYQVIFCDFRSSEQVRRPEEALEMLLGTMLAELGHPYLQALPHIVEERMVALLAYLEQITQPVVVLVDHSECLLEEQGLLAPCWERFLSRFLRSQHQVLLVLATQQWPGWFGGEHLFITEATLPPLTREKAVLLLQQLGLEAVPVVLLQEVYEKVGGIPLCLEWVAALVKQPLHAEDWEKFDAQDQQSYLLFGAKSHDLAQSIQRLLAEPHVFGGSLAHAIAPVLDRISANQHLSQEARQLLQALSVAAVPLAKPALAVLCPEGPRPLDELRRASLVVAYPHRAQLLPMVASAVLRHLTVEQLQHSECLLIQAYTAWVREGIFQDREKGVVITELATLLLKHHRLLEAAELLIRYGWLSFNLGHAPRLARLAEDVVQHADGHDSEERECGGLLLHYFLAPFLGKTIDAQQRTIDYSRILDAVLAGRVKLQPPTEVSITHRLMVSAMNELHFQKAQALLDACDARLGSLQGSNVDLQASLLEKRAWLFGRWCEYAEEQEDTGNVQVYRGQAITLYRQCSSLLSTSEEQSLLTSSSLKKRQARVLNYLGYHLSRAGQYQEALLHLRHSMTLQEQGFAEVDGLAPLYGDISQTLLGLGRFQEALLFDERAYAEAQRLANAGYTFSQEEVWIYRVNRGRLYLHVGRVDEAEHLLREALDHIHPRRRMYRMFADHALDEIKQWRLHAASSHFQFDWRWVERYRTLASFDSYWWLAAAGPFTEEEQRQWDQLYSSQIDEATKERLGALLAESREREVAAAIAERREPDLCYPAIAIDEVRSRIVALLALDTEIAQQEPNAIVRRFYHGTIEEEVDFLRLIEATYEGDCARFWEYSVRLNPPPSQEEMEYALSRVRRIILQGLLRPETVQASQRAIQVLHDQAGLSLDLSYDQQEALELQQEPSLSPAQPQRMVAAQTARRCFEAILQESDFEGWAVVIDPNASSPRVEQGLRTLYLPDNQLSVDQIKHYITHELAGHVARCVAGERSPLGLLGIHTRHSLETEEGLATYYDIQAAALEGKPHDETAVWLGALATGLASGVVRPPQTFFSLFTFFDAFIFLFRLLKRPDQDVQTAQQRARKLAIARCLRTHRGVPDLKKAGICYTKDVLYLRGLWQIERALARDRTILNRLAVGVVATEQLADLQELGITGASQPIRKFVEDPNLDAYILSFEQPEVHPVERG